MAVEMKDFPGGSQALAASISASAEAMRPLRWPAERLDTLGGYLTYHNVILFNLILAIYGAVQGARQHPHDGGDAVRTDGVGHEREAEPTARAPVRTQRGTPPPVTARGCRARRRRRRTARPTTVPRIREPCR